MPAAIAPIGWTLAFKSATLATWAYIAAQVAIQVGLSAIAKAMAGKPKASNYSTDSGRDVTVRSTQAYRSIIYGQCLSGGTVVFYGTSGTNNEDLWTVVVYATHQCQEITDVKLDSSLVADTFIDSGTGALTNGQMMNWLWVWKHLGTHNQSADSNLLAAFPDLGSTFKGTGQAYVVFKQKRNETAYPNGPPQNYYALIKGKRVYDVSKDSTNGGSGSHRYNDATTWEWSDNWADCVRDYLTGGSVYFSTATPLRLLGLKVADSKIDDSYTLSAHNTSAEDVTIPPVSPTTTHKRYTVNCVLSCGNSHDENLSTLLSAGAGHLGYTNFKYRIYAGDYMTPVYTITDDDVMGKVTVQTHPKGDDHYNTVTGNFYDEDRDWQMQNFPTVTSTTYKTDDGKELIRSIELHATRTSYRAQRIAFIHLMQSRQFQTVDFTQLSPKASLIGEWETFNVTITERGWTNKVFRCIKKAYLANGFVSITAREEASAAYADPSVAQYAEPSESVNGITQLEQPGSISNFTANGAYNGINFSWDAPTLFAANGIHEIWEHTSSTPFASAVKIWEGRATSAWVKKADTTQRYYWIRMRLPDGSVGETTPASNMSGIPGKATAVPSVLSASVSPSSIALDTAPSTSGTTASATVTASGGTGPYTYAWTWASGGTSITTTSATSNATTWSVTGMAAAETRSGIARCTVTDSLSATYTVDVSVNITRTNSITVTGGGVDYLPYYDFWYGGLEQSNAGIGSVSPTTLNGQTVVDIASYGTSAGVTGFYVSIGGFGSNPGATWFTSVKAGSYGTLLTSAATYSYASGVATWTWTGAGIPALWIGTYVVLFV